MAKFFETSDDIRDYIEKRFSDLSHIINFKFLSVTKGKTILKVSRASATTEYLTKNEGMVTVVIYEQAWDRLPDLGKEIITEMAYNQIQYDSEKDKINIESNPYKILIPIRKTFGDEKTLNILELQDYIIDDIEREEKAKKEAEKENKKNKQE